MNQCWKSVSADGGTVYATLGDGGAYFGEVALLLRQPHNASILAKEYADLYMLHVSAVDKVMKRYPDFAEDLYKMAEARKGG